MCGAQPFKKKLIYNIYFADFARIYIYIYIYIYMYIYINTHTHTHTEIERARMLM